MAALASLRPEGPDDGALADALIDRAFGPGRYAKAAERLRENNHPLRDLSILAWRRGEALGCVRLWPVSIGQTPAILLGPIAVEASRRSGGIGARLVGQACKAAAKAGHGVVLLVGDEAYFGPLGFSARPTRDVIMPGPVDQCRVLVRALREGAADGLGGLVSRGNIRAAAPLAEA